MAFGETEGSVSEFNEASFKMRRIHDLQERLNTLWVSPLAMNQIYFMWNYELIYATLLSLMQEVKTKLSKKEKTIMDKNRDDIDDFLICHKPHQEKRDESPRNRSGKNIILINNNWVKLRRMLQDFESDIRQLADDHGLGSPNRGDEGLF